MITKITYTSAVGFVPSVHCYLRVNPGPVARVTYPGGKQRMCQLLDQITLLTLRALFHSNWLARRALSMISNYPWLAHAMGTVTTAPVSLIG